MATLIIFDKFEGQSKEIERHDIGSNFQDWLESNVENYTPKDRPPFYAELNGKPFDDWSQELDPKDIIQAIIEPRGATIFLAVVTLLSAGYAYYVASNLPQQDYQGSAEPGQSVYSANARANTLKPSGIIRESAGIITIYPDVLASRRRFENETDEYLYLFLSVGKGFYDARDENIVIGETPIVNYEGDIEASIFDPGEDVSSSLAHENWYQSDEVSNLVLQTVSTPTPGDWEFSSSGSTMTSRLNGAPVAFPFIVGERFQVELGSNPGYYEVSSLSGSINETATLTGLARVGGDTGRLEVLTQLQSFNNSPAARGVRVRRNIFSSSGATTLVTAGFESVELTGINGGINWEGPFLGVPENETSNKFEIDFRFNGLVELDNDNEETSTSVDIAIAYREYGESEWIESVVTYTGASYNERVFTHVIDAAGAIRPEFRFRRVTPDSDSLSLVNEVEVTRLKCLLESPTVYDEVTTVGLRIRGTNALSATAENKISLRGASRKLPTFQEIVNAVNGTPFNLSRSATVDASGFSLDGTSFLKATNVYHGFFPENTNTTTQFCFSPDGTYVVIKGDDYKIFRLGELNNLTFIDRPYDLSRINYRSYTSLSQLTSDSSNGIRLSNDGAYMFTLLGYDASPNPDDYFFARIPLSPNYSVGSIDSQNPTISEFALGNQNFTCFDFNEAGSKLHLGIGDQQKIIRYTVPATFETPSMTIDSSVELDLSSILGDNTSDPTKDLVGIKLANTSLGLARKLFAMRADGFIFQIDLDSPGEISSGVYNGLFYEPQVAGGVKDFYVADGRLFGLTNTLDSGEYQASIVEYKLGSAFDTRASRSLCRFAANMLYETLREQTLDLVDIETLEELDEILEARGDHFDGEFVDETTLWEAIKVVLAPGYAEATIRDNKLTPTRIVAGQDFKHLYTPDVMLDPGLELTNAFYEEDEADGIEVEYFSLETNSTEVIQCGLPGDLFVNPRRVQAIGIVDATKAWRFGMRERRRERFKPAVGIFTTELDALNSNYGDPIAVASDLIASQCGSVTSYSGLSVEVDFEPEFGVGAHYAAFRKPDGTMSTLYTVTSAGSQPNRIVFVSPSFLDFNPIAAGGNEDPTYVAFGNADAWGIRAIARRIEPQGENSVQLTCEEYVEEIYADDDNEPG